MRDTLPDTLTPVLRAPARSRRAVIASVVALLVPLVILAVALMPWVIIVMAPGFETAETLAETKGSERYWAKA